MIIGDQNRVFFSYGMRAYVCDISNIFIRQRQTVQAKNGNNSNNKIICKITIKQKSNLKNITAQY